MDAVRSLLAVGEQAPRKSADDFGELHQAVMELAPEHRGDRTTVNRAAARAPDPER
ncbi:hypothetical protein JOH48_003106 [Bradyrhizobium elkanii]|nr:hypothetical protein [Bradyrhizobium elkanii]